MDPGSANPGAGAGVPRQSDIAAIHASAGRRAMCALPGKGLPVPPTRRPPSDAVPPGPRLADGPRVQLCMPADLASPARSYADEPEYDAELFAALRAALARGELDRERARLARPPAPLAAGASLFDLSALKSEEQARQRARGERALRAGEVAVLVLNGGARGSRRMRPPGPPGPLPASSPSTTGSSSRRERPARRARRSAATLSVALSSHLSPLRISARARHPRRRRGAGRGAPLRRVARSGRSSRSVRYGR